VYSSFKWLPWKFKKAPQKCWLSKANRILFFDWLGDQLGIKSMDDWYSISKEKICSHGGWRLLLYYQDSPQRALKDVYPNHKWLPWKFQKIPWGFFREQQNCLEFLEWLASSLGVKNLEDWYRISPTEVQSISHLSENLSYLLAKGYPEHKWDLKKFTRDNKKKMSQWVLAKTVESMFPTSLVYEEYNFSEDLQFKNGKIMELDIFVPQHMIAFEYQGEQHYSNVFPSNQHGDTTERDNEKRQVCAQKGITLIEVPYWWDKTKRSLEATLHLARPDILLNLNSTI
jgi:hypothetical protein